MPTMSRKVKGWALYYWGNHAFTTSIITVFFPIFFKDYWNHGVDVSTSTFRLGLANSCASLIVALSAPVLGAIADKGGHKKRFLLGSAFLGAVMVFALHFVGSGPVAVGHVLLHGRFHRLLVGQRVRRFDAGERVRAGQARHDLRGGIFQRLLRRRPVPGAGPGA